MEKLQLHSNYDLGIQNPMTLQHLINFKNVRKVWIHYSQLSLMTFPENHSRLTWKIEFQGERPMRGITSFSDLCD